MAPSPPRLKRSTAGPEAPTEPRASKPSRAAVRDRERLRQPVRPVSPRFPPESRASKPSRAAARDRERLRQPVRPVSPRFPRRQPAAHRDGRQPAAAFVHSQPGLRRQEARRSSRSRTTRPPSPRALGAPRRRPRVRRLEAMFPTSSAARHANTRGSPARRPRRRSPAAISWLPGRVSVVRAEARQE